jgi:hypothetical protein
MRKCFKVENPDVYDHFAKKDRRIFDGYDEDGKPINGRAMFPESVAFFAALQPWERHIPVPVEVLEMSRRELALHSNTSYAAILRRDIRFAEECNAKGDEMIVSYRQHE